ncbi:hypothetical protein DNTS_000472 [Danionella cerebrum]|uniref:Uncharacterized protein n=1 Tax=Danionella cerebrum TaxID=2873325 RepID=A0A553P9D0_9TELE|nr:hypothetical protein DNTS_000472 [Danionella translucida]
MMAVNIDTRDRENSMDLPPNYEQRPEDQGAAWIEESTVLRCIVYLKELVEEWWEYFETVSQQEEPIEKEKTCPGVMMAVNIDTRDRGQSMDHPHNLSQEAPIVKEKTFPKVMMAVTIDTRDREKSMDLPQNCK